MSAEGDLSQGRRNGKSEAAFRTISEVAEDLDVPQHVLRFWESKFPQVRPLKRGGGRRYYRPEDVALLRRIRDLLYSEGYTIKGVQKLLREGGHKENAATTEKEPELLLSIEPAAADAGVQAGDVDVVPGEPIAASDDAAEIESDESAGDGEVDGEIEAEEVGGGAPILESAATEKADAPAETSLDGVDASFGAVLQAVLSENAVSVVPSQPVVGSEPLVGSETAIDGGDGDVSGDPTAEMRPRFVVEPPPEAPIQARMTPEVRRELAQILDDLQEMQSLLRSASR